MQHTITPDPINEYAERFTSPESTPLEELNRVTHETVHGAQMLSGHLQGCVLQMISQMIAPRHVLEIGTYTGYSAICLAQGLQPGGKLHTIDIDEKLQPLRNKSWQDAGLAEVIVQHLGHAGDVLAEIDVEFDLVFIDADKKNYGLYLDLALEKVPSGGFLVADNVLFSGEVILPETQQSKNAQAIHQFNEKVAADPRVEQVILPIRDGLMVIRKK